MLLLRKVLIKHPIQSVSQSLHLFSCCRVCLRTMRPAKSFSLLALLCVSSSLSPTLALFPADASSPLRFHLRHFVFSLLAISAFPLRHNARNLFPPPSPPSSSFHPSSTAATVLQCAPVCVCVSSMFEMSRHSGTVGYRTPPPLSLSLSLSLSISLRQSFLSLTLHLKNRESLPLGSRRNNEVPAESGSSTAEQRAKTD